MNAMKPLLGFAKIDIKRLFRDKLGIFFVFVFPLIFLLVFGGLFGKDRDISFSVAIFNQSESDFAADFSVQLADSDIFTVSEEAVSIEDAKEQMIRGSLDAIITLPENFGEVLPEKQIPTGQAEVLYNRGNDQVGLTLSSILESIFSEINIQLVPIETPFTVLVGPTESEGLTTMDYIFSGLLGFTILSLGIFGPSTVFPRMKEKGVIRRYRTTPIRIWQYFGGNMLSNAIIGLMAVGLMFVVAKVLFNINMRGDYISLVFMVLTGIITLFGLGLAIGGWAKNENQAQPLANLIAFPMMFLSGVFFPRFLMPEWLQTVSGFFPLTPLVDGLRLIITEGKNILEIGPEIGLLLGWMVIIYIVAFKVFRWE